MRSISALSTVLAAAALVVGLSSCGTSDNDSAKATSTTSATTRATTARATSTAPIATSPEPITTSPTPITTTAAAPEPAAIACGVGPFGSAVFAITTQGDAACPTAIAVINAYAVQSDLWDLGVVMPVTVGSSIWDCQERMGAPNPYQECVNRDNPAERARLSS